VLLLHWYGKQLEMAAELVFVYAVLKPADGKKDEVESKL
jgi:hypothetical protein